jgi:hypothetical protein
MAWCDHCGNGFPGDGGKCPTCGHRVAYATPTPLPTMQPVAADADRLLVAAPARRTVTFEKLVSVGLWTWTVVAGCVVHNPGSASVAFFGACLFTLIGICQQ